MNEIAYTLLSDGSSDRVLMPIIEWSLRQNEPSLPFSPNFAELPKAAKRLVTLDERILWADKYYPCDILFIHRDCEKQSWDTRREEVTASWNRVKNECKPQAVFILPIRMTEAWLLFNELAIRKASGNPNGKKKLELPHISKWEALPDPKENLKELLRNASGLTGRKLKKLNEHQAIHLVADHIEDFSVLRKLESFNRFEEELRKVLEVLREKT